MRRKETIRKIKSKREITDIAEGFRMGRYDIVSIRGTFDLLHAGHLDILERASGLGDYLIVSVNTDESVRERKGTNRPIIGEEDRALAVASLGYVDYVTIFDRKDALGFIEAVRPKIYVNGGGHVLGCSESRILEGYGGRVQVIEKRVDVSSSAIIERILNLGS